MPRKKETDPVKLEARTARTKERNQKWRAEKAESRAEYMRQWRAQNKDRLRAYQREYEASHPELKKEMQRRYYETKIKTDAERIEKRRVYLKLYNEKNSEKHLARCLKFSRSHRAELNAKQNEQYRVLSDADRAAIYQQRRDYLKAYSEQNKETLAAKAQERYAADIEASREEQRKRYEQNRHDYIRRAENRTRSLSERGTYTKADVDRLYESQGGKCGGCKCAIAPSRSRKVEGSYEVDHVVPVALGGMNTADNLQLLCVPCNRRKHALSPEEWAARIGKLFV